MPEGNFPSEVVVADKIIFWWCFAGFSPSDTEEPEEPDRFMIVT